MNKLSVKALQAAFVGKVCTIITKGINRSFQEEQLRDHYVVLIDQINEDGVFGYHPYVKLMNFYNMNSIISIHEEQYIDQEDVVKIEEQIGKKIKSDIRMPNEEPVVTPETATTFVDINEFSNVVKATREAELAKAAYENIKR